MKLSIFNDNDSVLLLGEGNFTFAIALFELNLKINITATCYEPRINQETVKKNIEYLVNNGIRVLLGVDATNTKQHSTLKTELFDKIIFNFPHVGGKMRIEKNRELIKQFFVNAEKLIKSNGQVLVTLCNGQGGTFMDNPSRHWNNSWKVAEMAAHGNFILTDIEPFVWPTFQSYIVTGYRSLDKQFHCKGALTHIFSKCEPPDSWNIAPKHKIDVSICKMYDNVTWKDLVHQFANTESKECQNTYCQPYTFDITFSIDKDFDTAKFYIVLYNHAGCIIHHIDFVRSYTPSPQEKEKRTYRINYKSDCLPLYRKRIIDIHQNLITNILEDNLGVTVTR